MLECLNMHEFCLEISIVIQKVLLTETKLSTTFNTKSKVGREITLKIIRNSPRLHMKKYYCFSCSTV